jgi:glucokinase
MSRNRPGLLRFRNARAVLLALLRSRDLSRADLARELSISRPTVLDIVDRFVDDGVVREVGVNASGGRPGIALSIASDAAEIMAVDLGGTSVRLGRFDLGGTLVERVKVATDKRTRQSVLDQLCDLVTTHRSLETGIRCLVVGAPGYVQDGVVCDAPNLPDWHDVPLRTELEERLKIPVIVENDVDLAAIGEGHHGAARGCSHVVFLSLGTGIGCGIVVDGKLNRGAAGAAGEIAFLVPGVAELDTSYGGQGALETLASMQALPGYLPAGSILEGVGPEAIVSAAHTGDPDALHAVHTWAGYVALGTIALGAICNPEVIVIGGAGAYAYDLIEERLRSAVRRHLPASPRLAATELGDDVALWGGMVLGRDRVVERLASRQRAGEIHGDEPDVRSAG